MCTASKAFSLFCITYDLLRCPDLQQRIAVAQIHGVVATNTQQVHDVPEIPAHQDLHATDRRNRNMLGVYAFGCANDASINIPLGKYGSLLGQFNVFPVRFGDFREHSPYTGWRFLQLQQC